VLFYCSDDLRVRRFQPGMGQLDRELLIELLKTIRGRRAPIAFHALRDETGIPTSTLTMALERLADVGRSSCCRKR